MGDLEASSERHPSSLQILHYAFCYNDEYYKLFQVFLGFPKISLIRSPNKKPVGRGSLFLAVIKVPKPLNSQIEGTLTLY